MPGFYHPTKDAALLAGAIWADDFFTRAELEPYNGWVLVLTPKSREVLLRVALGDLCKYAEVDLHAYSRVRVRPPEHRRAPAAPVAAAKRPADVEPVVAPQWKPGDKLPW